MGKYARIMKIWPPHLITFALVTRLGLSTCLYIYRSVYRYHNKMYPKDFLFLLLCS